MRRCVFFPVRKRTTHTADTACDRMVASAAPRTPMFSAKIKTGSRMMLSTAPMRTVSMLVRENPCAVMKAFRPSATCTAMVPSA